MKRPFAVAAVVGASSGLLAGCSLRPAPRAPIATYDLLSRPADAGGATDAALPVVFVVHEPTGPLWLDSGSMCYRLEYDDPGRLRRFANSQWAVSPLRLLGGRLRAELASLATRGGALPDLGISADYSLRIAVEEFGQVFDAPTRSRAIVRFRVVLVRDRGRAFLGQRSFDAVVDSATADARGGVEALGHATVAAVGQAVAWVADTVRKDLE
jgi:cholesterol transport system auxiliary component